MSVAAGKLIEEGLLLYKPSPVNQQKLQVCRRGLAEIRNSSNIEVLKAEILEVKRILLYHLP